MEEERRQREKEIGEEREHLREQVELLRGMWEDTRQEAMEGRAAGGFKGSAKPLGKRVKADETLGTG